MEQEQEKKININFGIKEISTLKFSLNNVPGVADITKGDVQFQIVPRSFINYEYSIVGFEIAVNISFEKNGRNNICELITRSSFEVNNLQEFVPPEKKDNPDLPMNFMQTLLSISLSTTRGILAAKTEGSILSGICMPILNPTSFKPASPYMKVEG